MMLYYKRNHAQALKYAKRYYREHREEVSARHRINHKLERMLRGNSLRAHRRLFERTYYKINQEKSRVKSHRRRARSKASMGNFTEIEWRKLVARQKGRCAECKLKKVLTADHIIPIHAGGCSFIWNIQGLCGSCNSRKHTKLAKGAQFTLFDQPPDFLIG